MRMYEVKITLLADVAEEDLDEAIRLTHHAEGIFEEYPFLRNMSVNVDVLRNPDNTICGDAYKVEQLEKMLEHESNSKEEHYGSRLSHWYGDSNVLTIDAGGLQALIQHYTANKTNLE